MKTLAAIKLVIMNVHLQTSRMAKFQRALVAARKNIPALRAQMFDEGFPGSNEPFNRAVLDLEGEADELIRRATLLKDLCLELRNKNPEDWK
jgi:hypothetical protein